MKDTDISHLYWNTELNVKEIAKRAKVSQKTIYNIGNNDVKVRRDNMLIQKFNEKNKPKEYAIIKVESKWIEGIKHLLETRGIPHEVPEHFELLEMFESKINQ